MHRKVLSAQQLERRGANAVAELLMRTLIVPKIYFEASWPTRLNKVDVLAVDRAGAGDIHVVEVKVGNSELPHSIASVKQVPAHYKYLALLENGSYWPSEDLLYAADGMGRIGLIRIEERDNEMQATLFSRPERFRIEPASVRQIEQFTKKNPPDWEIRP
ncbi:MAG: hypothetical protein LAO06_16195 [Acidobacteriia bacterium]|nr:hypothetical protein [Terriglobia bacterium]